MAVIHNFAILLKKTVSYKRVSSSKSQVPSKSVGWFQFSEFQLLMILIFCRLQQYNTMNWDKAISQNQRCKVEKLIRNFELYLLELHGHGDAADHNIIQQWGIFRELIKKNPNQPLKLYKYLTNFNFGSKREVKATNELKVEQITKLKPECEASDVEVRVKKSEKLLLLKMQLKCKARQLLRLVVLNNRMVFKN